MKTKKQKCIYGGWKYDSWCNCYEVMHQLHWNKYDKIFAGGEDSLNIFTYDSENNVMEPHDIIMKIWSTELYKKIHREEKREMSDYEDSSDSEFSDEDKNIKYIKYDFGISISEKYNHVPEWDDYKCIKCGFVYDVTKIEPCNDNDECENKFRSLLDQYEFVSEDEETNRI